MIGMRGLLKSVYWNLKLLPLRQGIKLPILLGKSCSLRSTKRGHIVFNCDRIRPGILIIGTEYYGFPPKGGTNVKIEGKLIINGSDVHWFGSNGYLSIKKNACLEVGNNFHIGNGWCIFISCNSRIGDNCMFSWNILLLDTDCHPITDASERVLNLPKPFIIGDHVWIGASSTVLKGAEIPTNSIIATKSIVSSKLGKDNTIYVDNSAKKSDVYWSSRPL